MRPGPYTPAVAARPDGFGLADPRSQQGETLIEVLIAIVIIGLTVVALLGGLVTSITASGEHQSISTIDALMKSYAEAAKYQIELQPVVAHPPSGPIFQDCSGSGSASAVLTAYRTGVQFTYPAGYSKATYPITITKLQPWSTQVNTWDAACSTSGPNHDANGLQLLTIQATGPNGVSDQMQIVVRNPDYPSSTPNPYANF